MRHIGDMQDILLDLEEYPEEVLENFERDFSMALRNLENIAADIESYSKRR